MKRSTVELEIPEEVFEEARGIAKGGNRSVESVLQDGLAMMFGNTEVCGVSMESLENFSDEQLWKIINHQLTWAQDSRWRELMANNKKGTLSRAESNELDNLLDIIDRQVLMRTKALVLMKQRGHNIETYLGLGA